MKPYKIADQWVDLDHVLAVSDDVVADFNRSYDVFGTVEFAFRDGAYSVRLGTPRWEDGGYSWRQDDVDNMRATWESFKTAWKTKDTMFGSSK